eukprot:3756961-Pyramimonas_sp.AAC.1
MVMMVEMAMMTLAVTMMVVLIKMMTKCARWEKSKVCSAGALLVQAGNCSSSSIAKLICTVGLPAMSICVRGAA